MATQRLEKNYDPRIDNTLPEAIAAPLIKNPQDMYPHMDFMRWDIINGLIKKHGYKSYLEIGVFNPELNFDKIQCEFKWSVDPDPNAKALTVMTSDAFFESSKAVKKDFGFPRSSGKWDIIFIDGLHEANQVHRDILNALDVLEEGGTIVCHDTNPTSELMASPVRKTRLWCGNCWEAWIKLRSQRDDLSMHVVDTDFGVGIIQPGKQKKINLSPPVTFQKFQQNKKQWLNLISVDDFKRTFLK